MAWSLLRRGAIVVVRARGSGADRSPELPFPLQALTLGSYALGIGLVVVGCRSWVPRFMQLLSDPARGLAPQLFTLAVSSNPTQHQAGTLAW